jgi:3-deoxy-D-manno-octulosonate 8-phosphate phosphatase (KDO 8-P phosphatase)
MHNLITNLEKLHAMGEIQSFPKKPDLEYVVGLAEDLQISLDQLLFEEVVESQIQHSLKQIKMLVMDCDGVLTDGGMYFSKNGDEIKRFNAKDGQGVKNFMTEGGLTGIISAGISTGLVEGRAKMLGINEVYVGQKDKLEVLEEWLQKHNLSLEEVAYIGDDVKDIPVLKAVGFACCPADAVFAVKESVDIVLNTQGGSGCVREMVDDFLLSA